MPDRPSYSDAINRLSAEEIRESQSDKIFEHEQRSDRQEHTTWENHPDFRPLAIITGLNCRTLQGRILAVGAS